MSLKIRCHGESEKFCKIFWELNKALIITYTTYLSDINFQSAERKQSTCHWSRKRTYVKLNQRLCPVLLRSHILVLKDNRRMHELRRHVDLEHNNINSLNFKIKFREELVLNQSPKLDLCTLLRAHYILIIDNKVRNIYQTSHKWKVAQSSGINKPQTLAANF